MKNYIKESLLLGIFICLGLAILGLSIGNSIFKIKGMERTVTVKGLSEREVKADIAIWPIKFTNAANDLAELYGLVEQNSSQIITFLKENGFKDHEISASSPSIIDKQAQGYSNYNKIKFRYTASTIVTLYTNEVDKVRKTMGKILNLGKHGIVLSGNEYNSRPEFLYSKLNDIKPAMIEEATKKAREVAVKFAKDSHSKLGKIKRASQGLFTIKNRDKNTPYMKKVRVVTTIEYYLSD
jgi:hypothetical protein